jgi:hypothetical protein
VQTAPAVRFEGALEIPGRQPSVYEDAPLGHKMRITGMQGPQPDFVANLLELDGHAWFEAMTFPHRLGEENATESIDGDWTRHFYGIVSWQ